MRVTFHLVVSLEVEESKPDAETKSNVAFAQARMLCAARELWSGRAMTTDPEVKVAAVYLDDMALPEGKPRE